MLKPVRHDGYWLRRCACSGAGAAAAAACAAGAQMRAPMRPGAPRWRARGRPARRAREAQASAEAPCFRCRRRRQRAAAGVCAAFSTGAGLGSTTRQRRRADIHGGRDSRFRLRAPRAQASPEPSVKRPADEQHQRQEGDAQRDSERGDLAGLADLDRGLERVVAQLAAARDLGPVRACRADLAREQLSRQRAGQVPPARPARRR